MVSAELGQHARVSAAADSVPALAKALRQQGHSVTLALPRYPSFEGSGLLLARRLSPLVIEPGVEVTVLDGQLASGVALVLFDAPAFAEARPIFGEPGTPEGEADGARSALLCRAAVAFVRERKIQGRAVDVVHLHDWAAAPVAALLARDGSPPTVLTIHSYGERTFALDGLGLLGDVVHEARARVNGAVSPLRLGLLHAGAVTAVSPGFARELESEPPFRLLRSPILGVLDGLDYSIWNPATDVALESRFDAHDPSNKGRSKTALLRTFELELEVERPLLAVLLGSSDPEGTRVVRRALPRLLDHDLAILVAGARDPETLEELEEMKAEYRGDFAVFPSTDDAAFRRLLAGSDFVLTARRRVPSPLEELAAARYGALPIAFASGGTLDAVVDADAALETGTGFLYDELGEEALLGAVRRALSAYTHPRFDALRRRVLRRDVGWDRPAHRYLQIYRQVSGEPGVF